MHDKIPAKDELLAQIEDGWTQFQGYLKTLTDRQLTLPTDAAGWAIKDHLTHLAVWEDGVYGMLMGRNRRDQMGIDGPTWDYTFQNRDFDRLNGIIQQRHKDRPLSEVLAWFEEVHARLVEKIRSMAAQDLMRPNRDFQPDAGDDTPAAMIVVFNTYGHYHQHRPWIEAIAAGNPAQ